MGGSGAQVGTAPWIVCGVLLLLVPWSGCQHGPLVPWGDGYRHRVHGYAIGAPPAREPPWRRIDVPGADLAYRLGEHEVMSLRASCGGPQASLRILARHLRIGVGRHVVRSESEVRHRGLAGWQQTFDAEVEDKVVGVASVTLVDGRCTIDFVFSARERFEEILPDFDAWWRRYEPASVEASS